MKASSITNATVCNGLPLMTRYSFHPEILMRLHERLELTVAKHSQTFIATMVVIPPAQGQEGSPPDNKVFIRWLADFIRHLKTYDPSYLWVREETPSSPGRFHYHIALFLNGNLIQNPWGLLAKAQRCWSRVLGLEDASGLIQLCQPQSPLSFKHCGFKLVRGSQDFCKLRGEAFQYLSYLAKTDSKTPLEGIRTFGCSELKPTMKGHLP